MPAALGLRREAPLLSIPQQAFPVAGRNHSGGATSGRSFLVFLLVDQTPPRFLSAKAFPPRPGPHCDHFEETGEDGKLSMCVGLTISCLTSALPFPTDATATHSPERGGGRTRPSWIPACHPCPSRAGHSLPHFVESPHHRLMTGPHSASPSPTQVSRTLSDSFLFSPVSEDGPFPSVPD